jgi:hypothetical protein
MKTCRRHAATWLLASLAGVATLAPARKATAQESDPCLVAPVDGQTLRKAGKLLQARDRFAVCAGKTCPGEIVQQCTRWAHEVDEAIPSIVAAARDASARDLVDAHVSIDDHPAMEVGIRAIPLDAGPHTLVFHREGSPDVRVDVLLREGEKNREILATFAPTHPTATAGDEARPIPTGTWIAGAVGVVGLVSFGVFGALGVSERSSDHCDSLCAQNDANSVSTKLLAADISLGVGVVSLAVATVLYLVRPTVTEAPPPVTSGGQAGSFVLRF